MTISHATLDDSPGMSRPLLALLTAVLGLAFFFAEQSLEKSSLEAYAPSAEEVESCVETGSGLRQMAFLTIGASGIALLLRRQGCRLSLTDPLAVLALAFAAWCVLSITWSEAPGLTVKRVGVLACGMMAMLGLSRQATARDLHLLTASILVTYCLMGVAVEVALGNFRPWLGEYRFAGTVHPNTQGAYCAVLALASATALGRNRRNLLPLTLLAIAVSLMLLTRSRSALSGLAIGLAALALVRMPRHARSLAAIGAAWLVAMGLFTWYAWGIVPGGSITDALLLGRSEEASSLSGRLPLWNELLRYVAQRPLLGYGYDSFWTPQRIDDVSQVSEWAIHVAHSVYIDTLLSTGVVGALLLGSCVVGSLWRLGARAAASNEPGYSFLFSLTVLGMASGLLESSFVQPMLMPLIAACGIGQVAFRPDTTQEPAAE